MVGGDFSIWIRSSVSIQLESNDADFEEGSSEEYSSVLEAMMVVEIEAATRTRMQGPSATCFQPRPFFISFHCCTIVFLLPPCSKNVEAEAIQSVVISRTLYQPGPSFRVYKTRLNVPYVHTSISYYCA